MTTINPDDLEFIRTHEVYFEQARLDFLHGMQLHTRNRFEQIYKTYLDKNFVLTTWCSACVVDMMKRLATWYDQQTELKHPEPSTGDDVAFVFPHDLDTIQPETQSVAQPIKRRGRPRKQ